MGASRQATDFGHRGDRDPGPWPGCVCPTSIINTASSLEAEGCLKFKAVCLGVTPLASIWCTIPGPLSPPIWTLPKARPGVVVPIAVSTDYWLQNKSMNKGQMAVCSCRAWGRGKGAGPGPVRVGEGCDWNPSSPLGQLFGESGYRVRLHEGFEAAQWALGDEEGVAQMGFWVGGRRPCELSPFVPFVECQIVDATRHHVWVRKSASGTGW